MGSYLNCHCIVVKICISYERELQDDDSLLIDYRKDSIPFNYIISVKLSLKLITDFFLFFRASPL